MELGTLSGFKDERQRTSIHTAKVRRRSFPFDGHRLVAKGQRISSALDLAPDLMPCCMCHLTASCTIAVGFLEWLDNGFLDVANVGGGLAEFFSSEKSSVGMRPYGSRGVTNFVYSHLH